MDKSGVFSSESLESHNTALLTMERLVFFFQIIVISFDKMKHVKYTKADTRPISYTTYFKVTMQFVGNNLKFPVPFCKIFAEYGVSFDKLLMLVINDCTAMEIVARLMIM